MSDIDYVSFLLHTITIREEMGSRDRNLEKGGDIISYVLRGRGNR